MLCKIHMGYCSTVCSHVKSQAVGTHLNEHPCSLLMCVCVCAYAVNHMRQARGTMTEGIKSREAPAGLC